MNTATNKTPPTAEEVAATVTPLVDSAATIASAMAPQYGALILLGAAVLKQAPHLYADVLAIAQKKEPTAEDEALLRKGILSLANPENL